MDREEAASDILGEGPNTESLGDLSTKPTSKGVACKH